MPKKVTLSDVLREVYVWGGMENSEEIERPISYKGFKKIMLGSELLVNEKSIRMKYEQIVAAGYAKEHNSNRSIIILDVPEIRCTLLINRLITAPKKGAHTHTHTQGAHTETPYATEVRA